MEKFFALIVMAILVEAVITYVSELVSKWSWTLVFSIILGVTVAIFYRLDIPALMGIMATNDIVGQILSGIMIARGSNFIYDLIGRFTNIQFKTDTKEFD